MISLTNPTGLRQAYVRGNFLAIKEAKQNDVKALLTHVHLEAAVTFYDKLNPDSAAVADLNMDDRE